MEITEIRIKLMDDPNDRLKAFCSITLDGCFVVRDLKIIQGGKGAFVAMPSRKLTDKCPKCGSKNNLRAAFCNDCGQQLRADRATKGQDGRAKLYADVAHPINSECRDKIQHGVLTAFEEEKILAQQPGYVCRYDDYGEESYADADWDASVTDESDVGPMPAEPPPDTLRIEPASQAPPRPHQRAGDSAERHKIAGRINSDASDDRFGEGII